MTTNLKPWSFMDYSTDILTAFHRDRDRELQVMVALAGGLPDRLTAVYDTGFHFVAMSDIQRDLVIDDGFIEYRLLP